MMTIFIILLLIVLNGLFVAAEFALLGAPRAALEQMGASGNMVARRVSQILKTPRLQDRYIATACSPYMPSPRLANVMPSWAVAM